MRKILEKYLLRANLRKIFAYEFFLSFTFSIRYLKCKGSSKFLHSGLKTHKETIFGIPGTYGNDFKRTKIIFTTFLVTQERVDKSANS